MADPGDIVLVERNAFLIMESSTDADLIIEGAEDGEVVLSATQAVLEFPATQADLILVNEAVQGGDVPGGGVTDHAALTGLGADDHLQYHTDARGDARYELLGAWAAGMAAHVAAADPHTQYLTPAEADAAYSALGHGHADATTGAAGFMAAADKTKLDGIATGATANSTDATLLNRANHTGAQAIATVTGLQAALDAKAETAHTHALADVTGLVSALAAKSDTGHTHAQADITGLVADLAAKSDTGHGHSAFTSGAAGFAPASGGGTVNFLRADGTWAAPAGGGGGGLTHKQVARRARLYA